MIHLWGKNQEKDSRGSATVEAVIAFVGFLFVIFTILNVTNYCRAQMLISNAMDTVTKELTQYSYFYKASGLQKFGEEIQAIGAEGEANLNTIATSVGDLYTAMSGAVDTTLAEGAGLGDRLSNGNINVQDLNNALTNVDASFTHIKTNLNDMNTKFMDVYNNPVLYMKSLVAVAGNEGLELAKSHVLAAPLAKGLLLKHFGSNKDEADKALEQLGIVDGIDGMNFNMSTIFTKEHPDEIHLVVYYTVELSQMFDWLDLKVNMCKETRARAWLAGDHPVASNVKPAEPPAGGGAGGGAADPNTPEEPATPTAEELKAQMVAKYGQETIDAVCADADTSGWTEQDWEYQIWLYQHREEIEEVAGEEETPEETPDEEYIKNVMIVIYGPMMVSYVDIIEDTEGWTMQMWQAKIERYLYFYGELGTEMVALYGKEEVGEVRAAEDTSGWTREQWIAKLNENREKKEEEAESGKDTKIKPSNPYNVDAKPSGTVTKITDKMDEATKRSLMRENEAAETIAKNGYNIEQNPVIEGTTRNPDYIIEGEIFDCYSPDENTKIRNIASTIEEKVITKGQTERVVLNLDDWKGDVNALVKQLNDYPIEGLKEVIVVQNGSVQSIYP